MNRLLKTLILIISISILSVNGSYSYGEEKSTYLYNETTKFFPAIYEDPSTLDLDFYYTDGVIDDNVYCIRASWERTRHYVSWAGFCFLNAPENFGGPGIDLTGYTQIKFWARREGAGGNRLKIEYINNSNLRYVDITNDWAEYTLDITSASQLNNIWNIFSVVFDSSSPDIVYLDKIRLVCTRESTIPVSSSIIGSILDDTPTVQLLVDGRPYFIKGVGYSPSDSANEDLDFGVLMPEANINTVRTWGNECTFSRLDLCSENNIKMLVGYGMPLDIDYRDPLVCQGIKNDLIDFIEAYKDHPAVIGWIIGNEVYHYIDYSARIPFFELLNELMVLAKSVDPYHIVGYAEAGLVPIDDGVDLSVYMPDADFYGTNLYRPLGSDCSDTRLNDYKNFCITHSYDKPIILTEYGTDSWWECSDGGISFNFSAQDSFKSSQISCRWNIIKTSGITLGGCVFNWIDKMDRGEMYRWGILGGDDTGDTSRNRRPQFYAVRDAYSDTSDPIRISPIPDANIYEGEELRFRVNVENPSCRCFIFSVDGLPMDVNPREVLDSRTGEFRWIPSYTHGDGPLDRHEYLLHFHVTDRIETADLLVTVTVRDAKPNLTITSVERATYWVWVPKVVRTSQYILGKWCGWTWRLTGDWELRLRVRLTIVNNGNRGLNADEDFYIRYKYGYRYDPSRRSFCWDENEYLVNHSGIAMGDTMTVNIYMDLYSNPFQFKVDSRREIIETNEADNEYRI